MASPWAADPIRRPTRPGGLVGINDPPTREIAPPNRPDEDHQQRYGEGEKAEAGEDGRHGRRRQPEDVAAKGHRPHQRGPESHHRHQQCAQEGEGACHDPSGNGEGQDPLEETRPGPGSTGCQRREEPEVPMVRPLIRVRWRG